MTKISALSDIGTSVASNDAFVLVDVSDPTTPNKKIQQQNLFLIPDGSAGTPAVRFLNDTDVGLFRPTTNTLALATGGSERLRIDSSGRVGIGTSAPGVLLHLNQSGTGDYSSTRFSNTGASGRAYEIGVGGNTSAAGYADNLYFYDSTASALRMVLDSSGRVGIGTTNPGTPLDVSGLIRANDSASDGYAGLVIATDSATRGYIGTAYLLNGGSETDIGYRVESGNNHIWMTGATERARIDSSGRLLVGTSSGRAVGFTSLQAPVQVETTTAAAYTAVNNTNDANGCYVSIAKTRGTSAGAVTAVQNNDELGAIRISGSDGTGFVVGAQIIAAVDGTPGTNDLPTRLVFSVTEDGESSPRERMRISQDGKISIGLGDTINGPLQVYNGNSSQGVAFVASDGSGNEWHFGRSTADGYFYVVRQTGTGMYMNTNSWVATSDQRAKQNIADIESTIDVVKALKPSRFNWKADGSADVGFIAQQVQPLIPEAVVDSGDPDAMLGITQDKLLPFVVKALQEAVAKIESLEARLTAAGV
jgi:hypothetical protein